MPKKKLPALRAPKRVERKYMFELDKLVSHWRFLYESIVGSKLDVLADASGLVRPEVARSDDWITDLSAYLDTYESAVESSIRDFPETAMEIGVDTHQFQSNNWDKLLVAGLGSSLILKSNGSTIQPISINSEPWLTDQLNMFVNQNVALIKDISSSTRTQIERIILDGFQSGKSTSDIQAEILEKTALDKVGMFKKVEDRADLIAIDQINKLNGQLAMLNQTALGIETYIWRTMLDERVRAGHRPVEGMICKWDDPTVYKFSEEDPWLSRPSSWVQLHPGQDIRCRCYAEPRFEDIFEER